MRAVAMASPDPASQRVTSRSTALLRPGVRADVIWVTGAVVGLVGIGLETNKGVLPEASSAGLGRLPMLNRDA
jgi:hypothetical protein